MMHTTVLTRLSSCSGNGTTRQFPSDLQLIVHEQLFSVIVLLHDVRHHIAWGKVRAQVFTWLSGEQSHGHIIHEKGLTPLVVGQNVPLFAMHKVTRRQLHVQWQRAGILWTLSQKCTRSICLFRVRVGVRITVRHCVQCLPLFSLS